MAADLGFAPAVEVVDMDVNADGVVSPADAMHIVNHLAQVESGTGNQLGLADVNRDGAVSGLDALMIVNRLNERTDQTSDGTSDVRSQVAELRGNLQALRETASRPNREAVMQLSNDVREARADGQVTDLEREAISTSVDAVFNSAGISQDDREAVRDSIEEIAQARGVDRDSLATRAEGIRSQLQASSGGRFSRLQTLREQFQARGGEGAELRGNLQALRETASRPNREAVMQLSNDVREARADGQVTDLERQATSASVDAVFESAGISQGDREAVRDNIEEIAQARGVDRDSLATRAEGIRSQLQANSGGRFSRLQMIRERFQG